MIGIIVTGHGNFATGITTSVNLIAGKQSNYESVDFLTHYSIVDLENELTKAFDNLNDCDGVIVMSDLGGGSPFKSSATLGRNYKDVRVIGGANLPMVLETLLARSLENDIDELAEIAVKAGKAQVVSFKVEKAEKKRSESR